MILSIIIVNYNACYFLEQCLCSLQKAIAHAANIAAPDKTEIIVIDNHSTDQSRLWLAPRFPKVSFIWNEENAGFSKANNKALSHAKGEYILFLNPDTILAEDSISSCIHFLQSHADAAALGVRMIDGTGRFLKESKRGLPLPWAAFCKLSGLSFFFPRSRIFSSYYQGFLPERETHPVEVLSGAFMLIRKKVLDDVGAFDERFFMYAEDIDLSYRMLQAGYKNYYFAGTTIIHFKGESTQKDAGYVRMFYGAMVQFTRKHFGAGIFVSWLEAAIWIRSRLSMLRLFFDRDHVKVQKPVKTYLTGDRETIAHLQKRLALSGRALAAELAFANELIFCEGKDFSFRELIHRLEESGKHLSKKIHAANSDSIVGSDSSSSMGESIPLA